MVKVVCFGGVDLLIHDLRRLEIACELKLYDERPEDPQQIIEKIGNAEIVVSFLNPLGDAVLAQCSNLKLIFCASTGFDNVDLEAAKRYGIAVAYLPDYATLAVAEFTIGLMLTMARRIFSAACDVYDGCLYRQSYIGKELSGKTLGVIGCGKIGSRVIQIAKNGLGMHVIGCDRGSVSAEYERLYRESDVISLHVPLNKSTYHLIGAYEFTLMKQDVIILNTARGGVIDEKALIDTLQTGKIFAVGLDVLEEEPANRDNQLLSFPNVLVTPHIAYNSDGAQKNRSKRLVDLLLKYLANETIDSVV